MNRYSIPPRKMTRVIINSDAKNEVDDQFALVHAFLSESFELEGIISAHFGNRREGRSEQLSYEEIFHLLDLMKLENVSRIAHGAKAAMPDENTPVDSEGARLIIEAAMKNDPRPLHIAFLGPLTDMASALLLEPEIAKRNIRVIWIGGGNWPCGGSEYNLSNDIAAANCVFKSSLEVWQIPRNVYRMMPVCYAEMYQKVAPCGKIGKYLSDNVVAFNNESVGRPGEFRVWGDSPAVGLMLYDDCGEWEWRPAPEFDAQMRYIHTGKNRPIRVYKNIDSRFILEDFYAKLAQFSQEK